MTQRNLSSFISILAALVALLAVSAVGVLQGSPAALADSDCTISSDLVNSCRPWFGAAAAGNPGTPSAPLTKAEQTSKEYQFTYLGSLIGQPLDIYRSYDNCALSSSGTVSCSTGDVPFAAGSTEQYFAEQPGTYVDMNWRPSETWADADGGNAAVNAEIAQTAQNIAALAPSTVFLTISLEPQHNVSAFDDSAEQAACANDPSFTGLVGSSGTPAEYVEMWQNVENIFDQLGVTNVVWAVDYMGAANWRCLIPALYPGDDLVDWVLYDTYDRGNTTFDATAGSMYNALQQDSGTTTNALGQPVDFDSKVWGIGEFGTCSDSDAANAQQYYADATSDFLADTYPRLEMYLVYADTDNASVSCLTDYDANGAYDTTKQADFNQFATSVLDYPTPPDTTPPSVPAGLTATAVSPSEIDLSWQPSTDNDSVAGYYVYRNGTQVATVTSGTTYADTGLADGKIYEYTVAAFDPTGNVSAQSTPATATTPDTTPPTRPGNLKLKASLRTKSITLSWTASTDNAGVTGYQIYRDSGLLATVFGTTTTYTDTGLKTGTRYSYYVIAVDAAGNKSRRSATVSAKL